MISCVLFVDMVTCAFDSPYHACLERAAVRRPPLVLIIIVITMMIMILIMIIIYCNQRNNDQHDNNDDTSECKASSPGFGHHDNKVGLKYTLDANDDHDIN